MLNFKSNKIKFDTVSLIAAFKKAYAEEIIEITDWLYQQAMSVAPTIVDRAKIQKSVVKIGNELIGHVEAGGMGALITEWGSGVNMDLSNEALYDYIGGTYWNPARPDVAIVGRPAGTYLDLDNQPHVSSGRMEGKELGNGRIGHSAEHWLRNLIELSRPTVNQRLVAVMERFEIQKYLG